MKNLFKIILYAFWVWLIGFVAGVIVYPLHESNFLLFKSIMVVVGVLAGMLMLMVYFKKLEGDFFKLGIIVGIVWFIVNILLDLIVLVGFLKTPLGEYFVGIGIRYLAMPVMSIGVGWLLEKKRFLQAE
ncbi:hypothetical protein JW935_14195 [candidate division KSB1 bacterium]|nr:hypothetical protein [candidate division KSB1 bacterium]